MKLPYLTYEAVLFRCMINILVSLQCYPIYYCSYITYSFMSDKLLSML